jgi:hypothetical protein
LPRSHRAGCIIKSGDDTVQAKLREYDELKRKSDEALKLKLRD